MTTFENVISKSTMEADIVCISDDDEREEENKSVKSATVKMKNLASHYNVYENSYYVPESARKQLELLAKQQQQQHSQQKQQQQLGSSTDVQHESVVYVPDDCEEEILLIGPIRKLARQIIFGDKLTPLSAEFPYKILLELEQHLAKSLRNVSFMTETNVWQYVLEQLSCIKIAYNGLIDLESDAKFSLVLVRILSQYVNFRARKTAANKSLVKDQIKEICVEIWLELEIFLSTNFMHIIMVLIRTDAKDYPLDVVLYPMFEKTHELLLRGRHKRQTFPELLAFIVTVLFYKHWQLMFTEKDDRKKHGTMALISLKNNFERMPENLGKKYEGFIRRVDDRIHHSSLYKKTASQLFVCKFEVTKAINNFFREYEWFVFECADNDLGKSTIAKCHQSPNSLLATTNNSLHNNQHNHQRPKQQQQHQQSSVDCFSKNQTNSSSTSNSNNIYNNSNSFKLESKTTNDTDSIGNNHLDDDNDDDGIILIDTFDQKTNRNPIDNFDENANFSSATSPLTQTHENSSCSHFSRVRLKSTERKDYLNFSSFDDSKHASSSSSFRRLFSNSISDSDVRMESPINLPTNSEYVTHQTDKIIDVAMADSTSFSPSNVDMNGCMTQNSDTKCSSSGLSSASSSKKSSSTLSSISLSQTQSLSSEKTEIIVDTLDSQIDCTSERISTLMLKNTNESLDVKNTKTESARRDTIVFCDSNKSQSESCSSDSVASSVLPNISTEPSKSTVNHLPAHMCSTVIKKQQANTTIAIKSIANYAEHDDLLFDSLSPCSLAEFNSDEAEPTAWHSMSKFAAQRAFSTVSTYDDSNLKYRSVSPYFEQEHQQLQQLNQKTKSNNQLSVSSSTPVPMQASQVSVTNLDVKCDDRIQQFTSTSSNEDVFSTTVLVDSGIASPADESIEKTTTLSEPTSTMTDDCFRIEKDGTTSHSRTESIIDDNETIIYRASPEIQAIIVNESKLSEPTEPKTNSIADIESKSQKHENSHTPLDTKLTTAKHLQSTIIPKMLDPPKLTASNKLRMVRHNSLIERSDDDNFKEHCDNFLQGLYCDLPVESKPFAARRLNGFGKKNPTITTLSACRNTVTEKLRAPSVEESATEKLTSELYPVSNSIFSTTHEKTPVTPTATSLPPSRDERVFTEPASVSKQSNFSFSRKFLRSDSVSSTKPASDFVSQTEAHHESSTEEALSSDLVTKFNDTAQLIDSIETPFGNEKITCLQSTIEFSETQSKVKQLNATQLFPKEENEYDSMRSPIRKSLTGENITKSVISEHFTVDMECSVDHKVHQAETSEVSILEKNDEMECLNKINFVNNFSRSAQERKKSTPDIKLEFFHEINPIEEKSQIELVLSKEVSLDEPNEKLASLPVTEIEKPTKSTIESSLLEDESLIAVVDDNSKQIAKVPEIELLSESPIVERTEVGNLFPIEDEAKQMGSPKMEVETLANMVGMSTDSTEQSYIETELPTVKPHIDTECSNENSLILEDISKSTQENHTPNIDSTLFLAIENVQTEEKSEIEMNLAPGTSVDGANLQHELKIELAIERTEERSKIELKPSNELKSSSVKFDDSNKAEEKSEIEVNLATETSVINNKPETQNHFEISIMPAIESTELELESSITMCGDNEQTEKKPKIKMDLAIEARVCDHKPQNENQLEITTTPTNETPFLELGSSIPIFNDSKQPEEKSEIEMDLLIEESVVNENSLAENQLEVTTKPPNEDSVLEHESSTAVVHENKQIEEKSEIEMNLTVASPVDSFQDKNICEVTEPEFENSELDQELSIAIFDDSKQNEDNSEIETKAVEQSINANQFLIKDCLKTTAAVSTPESESSIATVDSTSKNSTKQTKIDGKFSSEVCNAEQNKETECSDENKILSKDLHLQQSLAPTLQTTINTDDEIEQRKQKSEVKTVSFSGISEESKEAEHFDENQTHLDNTLAPTEESSVQANEPTIIMVNVSHQVEEKPLILESNLSSSSEQNIEMEFVEKDDKPLLDSASKTRQVIFVPEVELPITTVDQNKQMVDSIVGEPSLEDEKTPTLEGSISEFDSSITMADESKQTSPIEIKTQIDSGKAEQSKEENEICVKTVEKALQESAATKSKETSIVIVDDSREIEEKLEKMQIEVSNEISAAHQINEYLDENKLHLEDGSKQIEENRTAQFLISVEKPSLVWDSKKSEQCTEIKLLMDKEPSLRDLLNPSPVVTEHRLENCITNASNADAIDLSKTKRKVEQIAPTISPIVIPIDLTRKNEYPLFIECKEIEEKSWRRKLLLHKSLKSSLSESIELIIPEVANTIEEEANIVMPIDYFNMNAESDPLSMDEISPKYVLKVPTKKLRSKREKVVNINQTVKRLLEKARAGIQQIDEANVIKDWPGNLNTVIETQPEAVVVDNQIKAAIFEPINVPEVVEPPHKIATPLSVPEVLNESEVAAETNQHSYESIELTSRPNQNREIFEKPKDNFVKSEISPPISEKICESKKEISAITKSITFAPCINIVPLLDNSNKNAAVGKKSCHRGAGRRTKPAKSLKVNHVNELALKEMINNLNVLAEAAEVAAEQIKSISGGDFSVTVKSIEAINDEKPDVTVSKATEVTIESKKEKLDMVDKGTEIAVESSEEKLEIIGKGAEMAVELTEEKLEIVGKVTETNIESKEEKLDNIGKITEVKVESNAVAVIPCNSTIVVPTPLNATPVIEKTQQKLTSEKLSKKRTSKTEKFNAISVRKSPRLTTARQAKERAAIDSKSSGTRKGKKSEKNDPIIDYDRALDKIKKVTERKKAKNFRAVDTIQEISPFKVQPVEVEKKIKLTDTYVQNPVHEKAIKNLKSKPKNTEKSPTHTKKSPQRRKSLRNEKKSVSVEKTKEDSNEIIYQKSDKSVDKTDEEINRAPEILAALNLIERKNVAKRPRSDLELPSAADANDQTHEPTIKKSKRNKRTDSYSEILRLNDNATSSVKFFNFTTPTNDVKFQLTNGQSADTSFSTKIENGENKYMSPLVMKKTFECKCTTDRDRILKRIKEFNQKFPPNDKDDDVITLITDSIPNDYMETCTTLIKIKKIFFLRFVDLMQKLNLGIQHYLHQMHDKLTALNEVVSIDSKIFDEIVEIYCAMKDEYKAKNLSTTASLYQFKNFERFLRWWGRKFIWYCTPNRKYSMRFYDTEESTSSDSNGTSNSNSNSQERDLWFARISPEKLTKCEDGYEMASSPPSKVMPNFHVSNELQMMQSNIDFDKVPEPTLPLLESDSNKFKSILKPLNALDSDSILPIDAANTIISFPNFVSEPADSEITNTNRTTPPKTRSPLYDSDEPLSNLPINIDSDSILPIDAANTIISFPNFVSEPADSEITNTNRTTPPKTRSPLYDSDEPLSNLPINIDSDSILPIDAAKTIISFPNFVSEPADSEITNTNRTTPPKTRSPLYDSDEPLSNLPINIDSDSILPIDAANTIISFPNFVSEPADSEITNTNRTTPPKTRSPLYDSDEPLSNLPINIDSDSILPIDAANTIISIPNFVSEPADSEITNTNRTTPPKTRSPLYDSDESLSNLPINIDSDSILPIDAANTIISFPNFVSEPADSEITNTNRTTPPKTRSPLYDSDEPLSNLPINIDSDSILPIDAANTIISFPNFVSEPADSEITNTNRTTPPKTRSPLYDSDEPLSNLPINIDSDSILPIDAANTIISFPNFVSEPADSEITNTNRTTPPKTRSPLYDSDEPLSNLPINIDSDSILPIDAANTIISFPNFVSEPADSEITNTNRTTPPKTRFPLYDSDDLLSNLPINIDLNTDAMKFTDFHYQLRQILLHDNKIDDIDPMVEPFDSDSMSIYEEEIAIPELSDSNNDALVTSEPQKKNEILLLNEIDYYDDSNIFDHFEQEYKSRADPTMGTNKKGYTERPCTAEVALNPLTDNNITPYTLSNGYEPCAPLKEILDPSRIAKSDTKHSDCSDNAYDSVQSNQLLNDSNVENILETLLQNQLSASENPEDFEYYIDSNYYFDMISLLQEISLKTNGTSDKMECNESVNGEVEQTPQPVETVESVAEEKEPDFVAPLCSDAEIEAEIVVEEQETAQAENLEQQNSEDLHDSGISYDQSKMLFDDIIEYDPEVPTLELGEEIGDDLNCAIKPQLPFEAVEPTKVSPPKADDFSFKQPIPYTHGPISKSYSSTYSSDIKSQISKRKHYQDANAEIPTKKPHKSDESETASSSNGDAHAYNNHSHTNSQIQKPQPIPTYIVKNISYIKPQSSPSLTRSAYLHSNDNGLLCDANGIKHHNGTDFLSNSTVEMNVPKIIKIKINNLPPDNLSKMQHTSSRRGKKYHAPTSKLYTNANTVDDVLSSKKAQHSSGRGKSSSSSNRGIGQSNHHWLAQVHYN